ncbi:polyketide cyclase/dehydrase (plasmid) [Leptolyngbya sp. BL0902]|nr:polyketide cyclase/dehydrase [Leptolyngbya sp. BL0902]
MATISGSTALGGMADKDRSGGLTKRSIEHGYPVVGEIRINHGVYCHATVTMKTFSARINIACPPDVIWSVLTDANRYSEWATGIHRLEGQFAQGEVLQLFTQSKPQRSMALTVKTLVRPKTFTLSGGLPLNLFRGDRTITLTPQPDGTTEFYMTEVFSGVLEPLLGRRLPDLTPSFEEFAASLKQACER